MGFYARVRELWKHPKENLGEVWNERLVQMRNESSVVKLERPTRIDRARSLGYKAKQGIAIVRVRVKRGGKMRPKFKGGRKTRNYGRSKNQTILYQNIAERRAAQKYENMAVLNSYYLAEDGKHKWYEVILLDPANPVVQSDSHLKWICSGKNRNRVFNGKTAAAKKSRGLL